MEKIIKNTRNKFIATIILVVTAVIATSFLLLWTYNEREIAAPAELSEVHNSSKDNEALAAYLKEQEAFEAHFVALASDIKNQDAQQLTSALAITSIVVVVVGVLFAVLAAKKLMKPVVSAYESQERFIQDAAHELRNPLAAMTVALQQADTKKNDPQLLRTFRRQTKRLIAINEDLLFLERSVKQNPSLINLSELLADVVEELQPLAASKNVLIELHTDETIQKTMVAGDYVRLMKNIIDNAIKYTKPKTTVAITQKKTKHAIQISVSDKGIGIPKKDLPHIGGRFFRASNTGTIDGTGLGLAIVQKILNSYGGQIAFDSGNTGTTVHVTLPA